MSTMNTMTPEFRKTVDFALTPDIQAILGLDIRSPQTESRRIADIIRRYAVIVCRSAPRLTDDEWLAICDVQAGPATSINDILGIPYHVSERFYELDSKWDIDARELGYRIQAMEFEELLAIGEFVDRFWMWGGLVGDDGWSGVIARIKESMKVDNSLYSIGSVFAGN